MRSLSLHIPHYHSRGRNDLLEAAIPFLFLMACTLIATSMVIYLYAASIS